MTLTVRSHAPSRYTRHYAAILVLCALALPTLAAAQVDGVHVTLTPYAGWPKWDDGINFNDRPLYGGRLGLMLNRYVGVEGTFGRARSDTEIGTTFYVPAEGSVPANLAHKIGGTVNHFAADLILNLGLSGPVSPYILGGYQQLNYRPGISAPDDKDSYPGVEFGVGLLGRLTPRVALRGEVRDVTFKFDSPPAQNDERQHNLFMTVGLQFSLGGRAASRDADGDGVRDDRDTCPGTPLGARVDANGCPIDSDNDGVPDGIDMCDATPAGARVDARGCPTDSDKDGVYDGLDQCANTPSGVKVDNRGCPLDADKDGVPDGTDKCPGTPLGAKVDAAGCPLDSDKDGVFDGLDRCANTPAGARVDKDGCPITVSERETELLDTGKITVRDINFETARWTILPESYRVLDEIGTILVQWPELRIEIGGHADARGSDSYNLDLSQKRAQAVLEYLTGKFPAISTSQYTARGYGESKPVATNATVEGMARNRRVEFTVLNTEELKKVREQRRTIQKDE